MSIYAHPNNKFSPCLLVPAAWRQHWREASLTAGSASVSVMVDVAEAKGCQVESHAPGCLTAWACMGGRLGGTEERQVKNTQQRFCPSAYLAVRRVYFGCLSVCSSVYLSAYPSLRPFTCLHGKDRWREGGREGGRERPADGCRPAKVQWSVLLQGKGEGDEEGGEERGGEGKDRQDKSSQSAVQQRSGRYGYPRLRVSRSLQRRVGPTFRVSRLGINQGRAGDGKVTGRDQRGRGCGLPSGDVYVVCGGGKVSRRRGVTAVGRWGKGIMAGTEWGWRWPVGHVADKDRRRGQTAGRQPLGAVVCRDGLKSRNLADTFVGDTRRAPPNPDGLSLYCGGSNICFVPFVT
ncbi:hypothetical protein E2C01_009798 [Portunus trituberculatus]|uniref:Uncharacterized protein n=1 Tax=Portunus trituberculatus TaxID=210409 RepID=A0A5B7D6Q9_PORTR|nr:hypothetical protein [Portunus trituberculatus]